MAKKKEELEQIIKPLEGSVGADGYFRTLLPSKVMEVSIRGMTGEEENLFAQDNRKSPTAPFFKLVSNCVKEPIDFKMLLMEDFMFILFVIRMLTYGDWFKFKTKCGSCSSEFGWEEDLSEIPIIYAKDSDALVLSTANPSFDCVLPISKSNVSYQLPVAYHQVRTQELLKEKRDRLRTEALRLCVTKFNDAGIVPASVWAKLPAFDLRTLEKDMDSHKFGIKTKINISCDKCYTQQEIDLPVSGADFLVSPIDLRTREDGRLTVLWEFQQSKS